MTDAPAANEAAEPAAPVFFPVGETKLVVLSICTFGLYEIYWFYKQWKVIAERDGSRLMPIARAVLYLIYCVPLFRRVRLDADARGAGELPAEPLAAAFIMVNLLWLLSSHAGLVFASLAVVFLIPVQRAANRINAARAPGHEPNARFSAWNMATVAIGGIFYLLSIVVVFRPPRQV